MSEEPFQTSPFPTQCEMEQAFLVGIQTPEEGSTAAGEYLEELHELVRTLGIPVTGSLVAPVRQIHPKFYVGSGKLEEIIAGAKQGGAHMLIFDCELGPSQQRNIEKASSMKVYDRQEVILEIFACRAQTREAVLQVELARNRYYLPRLTGAWSHLSRQRGGAIGNRGGGEKQIEYDRRMVKSRIAALEGELQSVREHRATQRKERLRNNIANCAIIGYTNAGKSTLLNALTNAGVLSEDKLFATLDPTTRKMVLQDKTELLLTDTVGFVRKLPHSLVEAFKSTLEEALLADFLLLVLDVSSPHVHSHWETTLSVLEELGASEKDLVVVFNKSDLLGDDVVALAKVRAVAPEGILISSTQKHNFDQLSQKLSLLARRKNQRMELCIPPERQDLIAFLHAKGKIHESRWEDDGSLYAVADLSPVIRHKFEMYQALKHGRG